MKMTPAHFADLRTRLEPIAPKLAAHAAGLKGDPKVKDLQTRVTWDAFHATRIQSAYSYQEFDYLDTHITTATRAALKSLGVDLATICA